MGSGFSRKRAKFPSAGEPAPPAPLLDDVLASGPVLLAFYKVSCPVCQFTLPYLERIAQSGGLRVVGVSQDSARDTGRFAKEFGLTFPMLLDQESDGYVASNAYGISTVPSLVLVEPGGKIALSSEGFVKRDLEELGRRAGGEVFRQEEDVPAWKAG